MPPDLFLLFQLRADSPSVCAANRSPPVLRATQQSQRRTPFRHAAQHSPATQTNQPTRTPPPPHRKCSVPIVQFAARLARSHWRASGQCAMSPFRPLRLRLTTMGELSISIGLQVELASEASMWQWPLANGQWIAADKLAPSSTSPSCSLRICTSFRPEAVCGYLLSRPKCSSRRGQSQAASITQFHFWW